MLTNYVINLASNTARQAHITQEFGKQAINFAFFAAVTPETAETIAHQLNIDITKSVSSRNEIACFLSHVSLWQRCIDDQLNYIGIYEDDIFLGENFQAVIDQLDFLQTNHVDILKLEKVSPRAHLTQPILLANTSRKIYQLKSRHLGAAGYILSRHACHYLLDYVRQLSQLEALDVILFDVHKYPKKLPVYQLEPAIVMQEHHLLPYSSLTSSLNTARGREIKVRLTPLQKAKREILRAVRPLYMSKLTFK